MGHINSEALSQNFSALSKGLPWLFCSPLASLGNKGRGQTLDGFDEGSGSPADTDCSRLLGTPDGQERLQSP